MEKRENYTPMEFEYDNKHGHVTNPSPFFTHAMARSHSGFSGRPPNRRPMNSHLFHNCSLTKRQRQPPPSAINLPQLPLAIPPPNLNPTPSSPTSQISKPRSKTVKMPFVTHATTLISISPLAQKTCRRRAAQQTTKTPRSHLREPPAHRNSITT